RQLTASLTLMRCSVCCNILHVFFSRSSDHRDLHSFPTRRSSDLVVSFTLPDKERADRFLAALRLVDDATSFGGVRSTAERRGRRSEEHTSELQSRGHLVCRLLLEKKKKATKSTQGNYIGQYMALS